MIHLEATTKLRMTPLESVSEEELEAAHSIQLDEVRSDCCTTLGRRLVGEPAKSTGAPALRYCLVTDLMSGI